MSQQSSRDGRFHNKKAGIRAAVILIGLLHKSRKAKEREREREREESQGWVRFVQTSSSNKSAVPRQGKTLLFYLCLWSWYFRGRPGSFGSDFRDHLVPRDRDCRFEASCS